MTPEVMMLTDTSKDRNGRKHAVIVFKEGRTNIEALAMDHPPVRVIKVHVADRKYMRAVEYKGKPYPLARALRRFREAGRAFGITKGAKTALNHIDRERKR